MGIDEWRLVVIMLVGTWLVALFPMIVIMQLSEINQRLKRLEGRRR